MLIKYKNWKKRNDTQSAWDDKCKILQKLDLVKIRVKWRFWEFYLQPLSLIDDSHDERS